MKINQTEITRVKNDLLNMTGRFVRTSKGDSKIGNTLENCLYILENDSAFTATMRLDLFRHRMEVINPLPWEDETEEFKVRQWCDYDDQFLRLYFSQNYQLSNCKELLFDAISICFKKNSYHPIRYGIKSLQWDGVKRIETLFQDLLLVDDNIYTREVATLFFVGAVARIMDPGTKFDYLVVLEGDQGIGKSSFPSIIAKNIEWYLEDLRSFNKAGIEQMMGKWIIELAELNAIKTTKQVEGIKSFISARTDNVRLAYERRTVDLPRECVFFGTTNESTYLKDKTGNRRFLPLKSKLPMNTPFDFDYLESIVDQLWAEAYEIYKQGYKLVLSKEALSIAIDKQGGAVEEDAWEGMIEDFLSPERWGEKLLDKICIQAIAEQCLSIPNYKGLSTEDKNRIKMILNKQEDWELYNGSQDHRFNFNGTYGKQMTWTRKIN